MDGFTSGLALSIATIEQVFTSTVSLAIAALVCLTGIFASFTRMDIKTGG